MATIGVELDQNPLVLTRRRDFKWSFENLDENNEPVDYPAGDLFFELETGGEHNASQKVTVSGASGGTYKLGHGGLFTAPIDFNDVVDNPQNLSGDITDALVALSSIGPGNVDVRPSTLYPVWEIDLTLNRGANEVQQIQINGSPTGGYYTLSLGAQTTGHIAYNANAAAIQTALAALPAVGAGNVTVTGTGPFTVTFVGDLALQDVAQLSPNYTHWVDLIFLLRTLTGGTKPNVVVTTTTAGSTPLSEQATNTINTAVNNFFDTFEGLLGVDINLTVRTNYNMTLKVTSRRSFSETGLITFAVDVTSQAIETAFNSVTALLNAFDIIHVNFYWLHTYQIEFINDLGLRPQPAMAVDITDLVGINPDDLGVKVEVIEPGKAPLTLWHFDFDGAYANLKVESPEADLIQPRTKWQLVFLEDGEPAGGDPITRGLVRVQE